MRIGAACATGEAFGGLGGLGHHRRAVVRRDVACALGEESEDRPEMMARPAREIAVTKGRACCARFANLLTRNLFQEYWSSR